MDALLNAPVLLAGLMFGAFVIGMQGEKWLARIRRAEWKARNPWRGPAKEPRFDSAEQMRCVLNANFSRQPLLNKGEQYVFAHLEKFVVEMKVDWRIMVQVSLGEVLRSPDKQAYRAINSKRVDFLIADMQGMPLLAVEYQGSGHHQGDAAARDAIKKEALRRAGVGYVEVEVGAKPSELRAILFRWATERTPVTTPDPSPPRRFERPRTA